MAGIQQMIQSALPMAKQAMQAIQKGQDPKKVVPQAAAAIGSKLGGPKVGQIAGQVAGQILNQMG